MNYRVNDNELIYMVAENCFEFDNLIKKYEAIVKSICNEYFYCAHKCGVEFDDLMQEANIALYNAYKNFNNNMKVKFYTYSIKCIRYHLNSYCRNLSTNKHQILNNGLPLDFYINKIFYSFDYYNYESEFVKIKNIFDFRYSIVFELRFNGFNYKEISSLLDISIKSVSYRICKIRSILSNYSL